MKRCPCQIHLPQNEGFQSFPHSTSNEVPQRVTSGVGMNAAPGALFWKSYILDGYFKKIFSLLSTNLSTIGYSIRIVSQTPHKARNMYQFRVHHWKFFCSVFVCCGAPETKRNIKIHVTFSWFTRDQMGQSWHQASRRIYMEGGMRIMN